MKLGAKLAIAFTFGLLIIGVVGVQSYLGIERVTQTNHWVMHSHEVLEDLEHVLSVLQDAETGQRGYILTGEDRYLAPYNAAAGEIQKDIDQVAALTADEPQQQESIGQLRALANDKLDELQQTIAQRKQSGLEAAVGVIRGDRGQRDMDQIRGIIEQMIARERGLLEARNTAAGEITKRSTLMVGLGVLLSLAIMGGAGVIIVRTARFSEAGPLSEGHAGWWGRTALSYAAAVAMVGLATAARWWLERHVGSMPLFITWYPAVLLVATIAGGGPGVVATLLSVLVADYWFIEPIGSLGIVAANDAVATGIFAGTGLFVSLLAERLRRSRYAEAVSVTQERELALLNLGNLMVLDLDHHIVRWSEGNHRLYGFDEQEAKGQLAQQLLQTRFPRPIDDIHRELLASGHWEGEVTQYRKDGTRVTVSLLWALRRDQRGRPEAILEVGTDLTPQKAAEDALRQQSEELAGQNEELSRQSEELTQQSEELSEQNEELQTQSEEIQTLNTDLVHREKTLQTLLDSARLPLGQQDAVGTICQAAIEMIGPAAIGAVVCEQQGEELRILAHAGFGDADVPACWPVKNSLSEMVMREGRTASLEDASLRPDLNILTIPGLPPFAAMLSSPLRVQGRCIGAVSILSATPQRWTVEQFGLIEWLSGQCSRALEAVRQAEALRQSQELLQALIDNCQALIYVKDLEGRILIANRPLGEAVGVSVQNLLGKTSREFVSNAQDAQAHMANDRRVMETGQAITAEESSGGHVFLSVKFPLRDEGGRIFATGGVSTDITDRKAAEEALRIARERAEWLARFPEDNPNPVLRVSADGTILYRNRAAAELPGWECLTGRPIAGPLAALVAQVMARGEQAQMEAPFADQTYLVWAVPFSQEGYVNVYARNITDRKRVEEALAQSRERLDLALRSARMATFDWDIVANKRTWSEGVHRLLGTSPETFTGSAEEFFQVIHPDDRTSVQAALAKALETPAPYETEYRAVWPNGTIRHIAARGMIHRDDSGRPVLMTGICWDITDSKRTQMEAAVAAEFLKIINEAPNTRELVRAAVTFFQAQSGCEAVGIRLKEGEDYPYYEARGFPPEFVRAENYLCARDAQGNIQRDAVGNPCIACMCGNVIRGRFDSAKPFFSPQGSFWTNSTTQMLAGTTDADRQARTRNRCNGQGYESVALIPMGFGEGRLGLLQLNDKRKGRFSAEIISLWERLASYLAVALAKAQAEEALQDSEQRFRTMADSMPQLAWIAKGDGFIYWYNRGWYEYTGTTPEQMEGWGWQSVHDPDLLPKVMERWKASIATGELFEMEFPLRGADGKFRQFLTRGVPLKDAQGRVMQWFGTNTDISERAAAENVLRQTAEELARSNKELEQFAYVSAHDLQEPLRQVRAYVGMLKDRHGDKLEGKALQYFEFVSEGAGRMSDLVQGLLEYSRAGTRDARRQPVRCQAALDTALANLRTAIADSHAQITHDELPTVTAEPTQLTQLFQNLIGNAVKFHREGVAPAVHVGCRREGEHWLFSVKDNGIGIDPQYQDKVFLIFQRLHGREKYAGTGIGLAICKKIIEQHGGKIWVESTAGEGSTFYFTLPA